MMMMDRIGTLSFSLFLILTEGFLASTVQAHRGDDGTDHIGIRDGDRMTIANMTCDFFAQPLNHFVPRGRSPTFYQRYCTYSGYATTSLGANVSADGDPPSPILFYTGNESPLEQYINHTGLMWELAPELGAHVVFVEHRYEGESIPQNLSQDCLSYVSTIQALADYADIMDLINPGRSSAVIAFGGSYGGMLSAWFRMKYPHLVAGAIAASAPIGAFPQGADDKIDSSYRVITHGMEQSYPPNEGREVADPENRKDAVKTEASISLKERKASETVNHCRTNLLASWPLIKFLLLEGHAVFLQALFRLCEPAVSMQLITWGQTPWFDMAEGSFPYPSSYLPFALLHKKVDLPPWPVQSACWEASRLNEDWGVNITGDVESNNFTVSYGKTGLVLQVDWDEVFIVGAPEPEMFTLEDPPEEIADSVMGLLESVRDAVSVWYNVTKDVKCYDIADAAPNMRSKRHVAGAFTLQSHTSVSPLTSLQPMSAEKLSDDDDPTKLCSDAMTGSWGPLCCNDEINLVITFAQGIGNDFFWPPSHPRGTKTYTDIMKNFTAGPCPDPDGVFGYSKQPYDPWSSWMNIFYGNNRMESFSNIVFSNGLLDPWSPGGIYKTNPWDSKEPYDGPMVQNITENDVIALIIEYGGHHTDLMYSDKLDPDCVKDARETERKMIVKWINDWNEKTVAAARASCSRSDPGGHK